MSALKILTELLGGGELVSPRGREVLGTARDAKPELTECPCCGGEGGFDTWSKPCDKDHMHFKMECPTCNGERVLVDAADYTRCPECEGKGGFDTWDRPCMRTNMHYKGACPKCDGSCYIPPDRHAEPTRQDVFGDLIGSVLGQHHRQEEHAPPPPDADDQAGVMIRALIFAAKSDGRVDDREHDRILARFKQVGEDEYRFLLKELAAPVDIPGLVKSVPIGSEQHVYALSVTAIDLDSRPEAEYLQDLAAALRLQPATCNEIHRRLGAPEIF